MKPTLTLLALFAAVACSSNKSNRRAARTGGQPEAPVTVHKSLDKYVRVLDYKTEPTKDGRLQIRVRLASDARTEVTMIAHTDWFDDDGGIIEQGSKRIVLLRKAP